MDNFSAFREALLSELEQVAANKQPVELYEPVQYILKLGGKRLRPILTLLAAEAYGDWKSALNQALCVEVFHNFTLVHDDIMDDAPLRRGKVTVHEKWGINRGILSGDAMMIEAYQLLIKSQEDKAAALLKVFNQVALEVCEGQQYDVNFETMNEVSEDDYINMIRLKTSVLLGAALEMGAIVAAAPEEDWENLYAFGEKLGIAFQIKDDVLDVYGDPEKFGKQVGGDILSNKKTLLMLHARKTAQGDDAVRLEHWLKTTEVNQDKIAEVTAIFNNTDAKGHASQIMDSYYAEALSALELCSMPVEKKESFKAFADWLMNRDH